MSSGKRLPGNLEDIIKCQEDTWLPVAGKPAHYYRFFFRLMETIKPEFTLELGTSFGHSSACMADGNPDGIIVTVNYRNELRDECRRTNVVYMLQDSLVAVNVIASKKIDVLFIDTDHDGIRPRAEFDLYKGRVAKDGLVFFDDIELNQEMKDFWAAFNPEGWEKLEIPAHGEAGFGCLIKTDDDGETK